MNPVIKHEIKRYITDKTMGLCDGTRRNYISQAFRAVKIATGDTHNPRFGELVMKLR